MDNAGNNKLMKEYVNSFFTIFRILEVSGFCRFIIRNGKIVERTWTSMLYNVFVVITADLFAMIILWTANLSEETLSTIEFATIVYFSIFSNLSLFQITFGDKYRGPDMIKNCIEFDHFVGSKETEFMRKLTFKFYIVLVVLIGFAQVGFVCYMYYIFNVSITIHVVGSTYFLWLFFAYDDLCFFLFGCLFLTTRARYLNVALVKRTHMHMENIPKQLLFSSLFWRDQYDDRVTLHTRAQSKDFSIAFKMLFNQLRHMEKCYSFPITLTVITIMMGSFVTVQTFIMYIEASTAITRASVITGWAIASWFYILAMSLVTNMFHGQIEQTKLICAYTQLKSTCPAELHKLTKDVITTLEVRDARVSLNNVYFFDTGLVFNLAASTFVYITVQLQLAFPNFENTHKIENATNTATFELQQNVVKEFLFL